MSICPNPQDEHHQGRPPAGPRPQACGLWAMMTGPCGFTPCNNVPSSGGCVDGGGCACTRWGPGVEPRLPHPPASGSDGTWVVGTLSYPTPHPRPAAQGLQTVTQDLGKGRRPHLEGPPSESRLIPSLPLNPFSRSRLLSVPEADVFNMRRPPPTAA